MSGNDQYLGNDDEVVQLPSTPETQSAGWGEDSAVVTVEKPSEK